MRLFAWAAALAVACLAVPAAAQTPVGKTIVAPAGFNPSGVTYCDDGTQHAIICPNPRADVAGTGTITASLNAAYVISIANGQNTATMVMSGLTASGATLTLEGSNDGGTTWTNVFSPSGSTGVLSNTFTADGSFSAGVAGRTRLRLRVSAAGTGTIGIASNLSAAVREVRLDAPLPPGANRLGDVGIGTSTPATSTPLSFSTTTAQTFGPWTPQRDKPIYAAFAITGGTASLQVLVTTDGICADGFQLSSANGTFIRGKWVNLAAGRYREVVGSEGQVGAQLCLVATPGSGATISSGSLGQ